MKNKYILILLPLTFILMTSACEDPPGENNVPPEECDFSNGKHDFDGIILQTSIVNKPFNWDSDHDVNGDDNVDDKMLGIFDNNPLASEDNPKITLTLTGVGCTGTENRVYTEEADVYPEVLYNAPTVQDKADIKLEIKSAEYSEKVCYWEREFLKVAGGGFHSTGIIFGVWQPTTKAMDDGDERSVYVHNSFNDYIYNYQ